MTEANETLLIVEDEEHDVEFLKRAFRRVGAQGQIEAVSNGEEAIAYLQGTGVYANRTRYPYPRYMVTDLKMPQMTGLELLRWLDEHPQYRIVPTIVLTSSMNENDVLQAYRYGASGFFVKPVHFAELQALATLIAEYWHLSLTPPPQPPL